MTSPAQTRRLRSGSGQVATTIPRSGQAADAPRTPAPVLRWIIAVALTAASVMGIAGAQSAAVSVDWGTVSIIGAGILGATLIPIRYRIGGSVHGVTAELALVAAALLILPAPIVPVVHVAAVAMAHLLRGTPHVRLSFNVATVALASACSCITFVAIGGSPGSLDPRSLGGVVAGVLIYEALSAGAMAELFRRLGADTFTASILNVVPVVRVTLPASLITGVAIGAIAQASVAAGAMAVATVLIGFATFRVSVALAAQRQRNAQLRTVALMLVTASASLESFDEALGRVAELFGADSCELLLDDGHHRHIAATLATDVTKGPTAAALLGLASAEARSLTPGSADGGPNGALVAPLSADGAIMGSVVLHSRRGIEPWESADADVLAGVACEILIALNNAQLVEDLAAEREGAVEQARLLSGVLASASDAIALVAADGTILTWNPAFAILAGTGHERVEGRLIREVLRAKDDRGLAAGPACAIASAAAGTTMARTWRVDGNDGAEPRYVRVVLSPAMHATAGEAAVLIARDVTESREVDQRKTDFIATVSHELRTPLTPIKAFVKMDRAGRLDGPFRNEMLIEVDLQVARLEQCIDDMLAMAELESSSVDDRPRMVDLHALIGDMECEHPALSRIETSLVPVNAWGDEDAIRKVIHALVNNALVHTDGPVQVRLFAEAKNAVIEVIDQGPGIAPNQQEFVFQPFARLGDHLLRRQGPGLGLAIAREVARQMGGDVTVESVPTRGCTFRIHLPQVPCGQTFVVPTEAI